MSIVKTFFGTHIDLSKIISISDARYIDRMGYGGLYVGFEIIVQLRDEPIKYERKVDQIHTVNILDNKNSDNPAESVFLMQDSIERGYHVGVIVDGKVEYHHHGHLYRVKDFDPKNLICVINLQKQIDELLNEWKIENIFAEARRSPSVNYRKDIW